MTTGLLVIDLQRGMFMDTQKPHDGDGVLARAASCSRARANAAFLSCIFSMTAARAICWASQARLGDPSRRGPATGRAGLRQDPLQRLSGTNWMRS